MDKSFSDVIGVDVSRMIFSGAMGTGVSRTTFSIFSTRSGFASGLVFIAADKLIPCWEVSTSMIGSASRGGAVGVGVDFLSPEKFVGLLFCGR